MQQVPISLIIPTWNGRTLLEACLGTLARSTVRAQLLVVDNGSVDGTAAWLRDAHPEVRVVRNRRNRGFAAAVNQGIAATSSAWVALLNNDALPEPDWLERLLAAAETATDTGSVATRMMFPGAGAISSAGIRLDRSAAPWDLWLGETAWPSGPVEVFGASGGACLLRQEMLDDIGLFDEGFFAYLEDADLAWRARLRGWKAVLAPDAVVYHALSSTSREGSPFKRYQLARNKWRMIIRNYPMPQLLENWAVILGYDVLSVANSLVHGDTAALHGRLDAFRELPLLLRQRREIQARRTASWSDIAAAMSPLESPLTLRRRAQLVSRLARS